MKEDVVLSAKMAWRARIADEACLGQQMILRPQRIAHELIPKRHIR
jgi:hypothetical protein